MINRVTLLGRIGKKDFKMTRTGAPLCQLSIATEEKWIDSMGGQKKETTWHNVSFFNKLAEIANTYTLVGDLTYIEGKISNRKIVDDNGVNRMVHSIIGSIIQFIPRGNKDNADNKNEPSSSYDMPHEMIEDTEIPF